MYSNSSSFPWRGDATALAANPAVLIVLVPVVTLLFSYLVSWIASPLRGFPGPALACQSKYFPGVGRAQLNA